MQIPSPMGYSISFHSHNLAVVTKDRGQDCSHQEGRTYWRSTQRPSEIGKSGKQKAGENAFSNLQLLADYINMNTLYEQVENIH